MSRVSFTTKDGRRVSFKAKGSTSSKGATRSNKGKGAFRETTRGLFHRRTTPAEEIARSAVMGAEMIAWEQRRPNKVGSVLVRAPASFRTGPTVGVIRLSPAATIRYRLDKSFRVRMGERAMRRAMKLHGDVLIKSAEGQLLGIGHHRMPNSKRRKKNARQRVEAGSKLARHSVGKSPHVRLQLSKIESRQWVKKSPTILSRVTHAALSTRARTGLPVIIVLSSGHVAGVVPTV